jgi:hypothetical protein
MDARTLAVIAQLVGDIQSFGEHMGALVKILQASAGDGPAPSSPETARPSPSAPAVERRTETPGVRRTDRNVRPTAPHGRMDIPVRPNEGVRRTDRNVRPTAPPIPVEPTRAAAAAATLLTELAATRRTPPTAPRVAPSPRRAAAVRPVPTVPSPRRAPAKKRSRDDEAPSNWKRPTLYAAAGLVSVFFLYLILPASLIGGSGQARTFTVRGRAEFAGKPMVNATIFLNPIGVQEPKSPCRAAR